MFKLKTRYYASVTDVIMVILSWVAAFWFLSTMGHIPPNKMYLGWVILPLATVVQAMTFYQCGLYRGFWRYISLPDVLRIVKSVLLGASIVTFILFFVTHLNGFPRSVIPVYSLLLMLLLISPRMLYRWIHESCGIVVKERILIVGAGEAGHLLVRDLIRHAAVGYKPIAFVDDDPNKLGKEVYGVRVVGNCEALPRLVESKHITKVLIAIPTASASDMRRIVRLCQQAGVSYRTLPSLTHIATGDISIDRLHEVSLDDLLGREPVKLDWQNLHAGMNDKIVLVTGGGGSIGQELCFQLAKLSPKQIVVVEQSEFNLYQLQSTWAQKKMAIPLRSHLLDCTDKFAITRIMKDVRPDYIFHAAAYKHVPLLEDQLYPAIKNNVIGTQVMAEVAIDCGVDKFILISTDKAVNPKCIMGKTKRATELFCECMNNKATGTQFITVRFGNVLGSAGSVVPLFQQQINNGGPVTVTHPDMKRYFMTISEASLLILQSALLGKGGEIIVLDMGTPLSVRFLAEQMIQLAGHKPYEDIDIQYTGLRVGEKLEEALFYDNETLEQTPYNKIFIAAHHPVDVDDFMQRLDDMHAGLQADVSDVQHHHLLDALITVAAGQPSAQKNQSEESHAVY